MGATEKLYVLGEFSLNVLRFDGLTGAFIDEFISPSDMGSVGLTDRDSWSRTDGNLYILHHVSAYPTPL
jgi:hypothetical protein